MRATARAHDRKVGPESQSVSSLLQDRRGFVWAGTVTSIELVQPE